MTDPKQMPELLPCPFCGDKAVLEQCRDFDIFAVYCLGCECEQRSFTVQGAVDLWNTRADLVPSVDPDAVRDFPNNTCPASRTVQQWADEIDRVGVRVLQDEDPTWIAETLRAVVTSLWACRTMLDETKEVNDDAFPEEEEDTNDTCAITNGRGGDA